MKVAVSLVLIESFFLLGSRCLQSVTKSWDKSEVELTQDFRANFCVNRVASLSQESVSLCNMTLISSLNNKSFDAIQHWSVWKLLLRLCEKTTPALMDLKHLIKRNRVYHGVMRDRCPAVSKHSNTEMKPERDACVISDWVSLCFCLHYYHGYHGLKSSSSHCAASW